ncbi:MAG: transporter substrate-binding domain-containing protein [Bifidobacteriaceae bacterium]|nr:transporter substrate-binding domain-containing protein [Bifidobacteriaceae bacterium]
MTHSSTRKTTIIVAALVSAMTLMAGCGGQVGDISGEGAASATAAKAKTIVVATSANPSPMTEVDANGKLTGYEIELLRAADKIIPEYNFTYDKVDFTGITGGLDSGKYQIGANFFNYTKERAEKFIFSKHPHYRDNASILTQPGWTTKHPITTLADLGGYSVPVDSNGSAWEVFAEDYNKLFPKNPMKLTYTNVDHATRLREISSGQFAFGYGGRFHQKVYGTDLGVKVDYVKLPDSLAKTTAEKDLLKTIRQETYFLFPKTAEGQKIADAVDKALVTLHKNGTMQKLSKQFLGYDLTGTAADWKE